jgi:hypothetical protein
VLEPRTVAMQIMAIVAHYARRPKLF